MDLAPLLCIVKVTERPLLFLIRGPLLAISTVFAVFVILVISLISHVDFLIVLLLLHGPLATRLKKSSPGFRSLNAYIGDYEQIDHYSGLPYGDLLHNLDVADFITEGIDDLNVLDIRDDVPGVVETFHVVLEALIMLLLDGLQSLNSRWTMIRALKVHDEHAT
jgi:hypothetical protein